MSATAAPDPAGAVRSASYPPLSPGGPRLVAIGGGHGLARTLGAARRLASQLSAVVSVADDGGSSGRLREALQIPAPGDVRRCLGALLPGPSPLGSALEHRFVGGDLDGHAFGNLLLAALAATSTDFPAAVAEACRILSTVGEVLPATATPVVLKAEAGGDELEGQVAIMATPGLDRVSIVPGDAEVPARVLAAIAEADAIVVGPGSLFTSVLAACAPAAIVTALDEARGRLVYVANLREQIPETAGYDVGRHLAALAAHGIGPDVVIADTSAMALGEVPSAVRVLERPLASVNGLAHDERLLARALGDALI